MPVYEYKCEDCNNQYDVFHKSINSEEEIVCPTCNSIKSKKLLSSFSSSISADNSSSCNTGSCSMPAMPSCANGMCGLN